MVKWIKLTSLVITVYSKLYILIEELSQASSEVSIKREKLMSLLQLLARIKHIHWGANNERIVHNRRGITILLWSQIPAEFNTSQADADSENAMRGIPGSNVLDDHVKIIIISCAISSRSSELNLDAAVVHDYSRAAEFHRLVGQMRHVIVLRRAGETWQYE